MGDLDIKFSKENDNKKLNSSLDLKLNNGQFQKVEPQQPKPDIEEILKEEYYENLFEEKPEEVVEAVLNGEDLQQETEVIKVEEQEEFSPDKTLGNLTSQLADEIFEEIEEETATQEETETETDEESQEEETETEADEESQEEETETEADEESQEEETETEADEESQEEETETETDEESQEEKTDEESEELELADEKAIITDANSFNGESSQTDGVLKELSFDTQKGKYDFINLCVLVIMLLFVGLTFIVMKQELVSGDTNPLTAEALKTGDYTNNISEKYHKNLPMEKIMAQGEVIVRKIFGDKDAEFIKFKENAPPDGPVDDEIIGGMTVDDEGQPVVTTTVTVTADTTTTAKLPQDFEITTAKQDDDDSPLFTGRPIKTTTTKVTTTLDLPETTDETTTGKVELIFP